MTNTLPTVDIKGKQYVMVKDRILAFNDLYKNGSIETELISPVESTTIIVKAIVTPDVTVSTRRFVDYSQAVIGDGYINKTSALENASTSAVGRALAYMGIGVIESIASADEVVKATNQAKDTDPAWVKEEPKTESHICKEHNKPLLRGVSKTKFTKEGQPKVYWYHIDENKDMCFGYSAKQDIPLNEEDENYGTQNETGFDG